MPTKDRPEYELIKLFLSAYDNDEWKDCELRWPECEKESGTVEVLATRKTDGRTLAIEHTLIQPYEKYTTEFARLNNHDFRSIEADLTLVPPGRWVRIFIATGEIRPGRDWNSIKTSLHDWLRNNLSSVRVGNSNSVIPTPDGYGCKLLFQVTENPRLEAMLNIGIDGADLPSDSLDAIVKKALENKLPKLLNTHANVCILLLERNELTLGEDQISRTIESHRAGFPMLDGADVWFAETTFYKSDRFASFYFFDKQGNQAASLNFKNGQLLSRTPF